MIESGRGRLALALLLCLAMLGADAPPAAQERPGEGRRGEEKKPEAGPSLDDLRRQIEQGSRESSGSPTLPSGSGSSGSVIDTLRGRPRPEPAPAAPSTPSFGDSGSGSLGASGAPASPKPFFLDVQAPAQVVYNGAPPAPCVPAAPPSATGRAAAPAPPVTPQTNQAAICVTGSAFEASAQIQIRPAPSPYLTQVMNTPGNPGQAIYLFTAPGPGKYRFMFEARLGSDSQTRDVEIEVREAGDASARIFLDVRAPAEIVFNGPPPPQLCAGGPRPGRNQAVICVTGTSFDRTFQVVVEAAQVPGLVEASNNGRGQAVYVFTAPGPGTYKLVFRARIGNASQLPAMTMPSSCTFSTADEPSWLPMRVPTAPGLQPNPTPRTFVPLLCCLPRFSRHPMALEAACRVSLKRQVVILKPFRDVSLGWIAFRSRSSTASIPMASAIMSTICSWANRACGMAWPISAPAYGLLVYTRTPSYFRFSVLMGIVDMPPGI